MSAGPGRNLSARAPLVKCLSPNTETFFSPSGRPAVAASESALDVVVVVGNPKPGSRTRQAAELVAERVAGHPADEVIELADLGPRLLGWGDEEVGRAKARALAADLVVVASPTFKATYTGLLKLFLEQFDAGELAGTPALPVMLGGSPAHQLAGEHTLKPVLVEIGFSCPTPSLYLLDSEWDTSPALAPWLEQAKRTLGVGSQP
ncbi:MAG: NAD(P)H-dependent oxidoreductase [Actinobacteria bacterium]|nr:NAD(P)H-dependent oxidoreductase [Actinomycetota bacterium]